MYTRSYYPEEEKVNVPENYDGYAFSENEQISERPHNEEPLKEDSTPPLRAPWDTPKEDINKTVKEAMAQTHESEGVVAKLFGRLPFNNLFSGLDFFKKGFTSFGTEEILIIGVALFLLLSKGGDKECAVMLLLLLFVK